MTTWTAIVMLYLILDPVGNTPLVITLLKDVPHKRRRWIIVRENLIALGVLLFFLFFGKPLLGVLDIKGAELGIAGGVVIFLISMRMMFPVRGGLMGGEEELDGEPFIVPLAIPLLAGPSAIAVVMLLSSAKPDPMPLPNTIFAVVIAWAASLGTLMVGHQLARVLGRRGIIATERLMGMVLCVISIHMMLEAIESYFGVIRTAVG